MKKEGKVLRWDAARGFGFIRSADTSADIFSISKTFAARQARKKACR